MPHGLRGSARGLQIDLLVALAVGWALAVVLATLVYRLLLGRGRLLLRLEALETRMIEEAGIPSFEQLAERGLPIGSPAPDFALRDRSGRETALESWRGRRILLVFLDRTCSFCQQLLPRLAALPDEARKDHPVLVLVVTGDPGSGPPSGKEQHVVLSDPGSHVASLFLVPGVPAAYLVDEQGLIASQLAIGADAILALQEAGNGEPRGAPLRLRPLGESRLNRTGLAAGTPAPAFTLPLVVGSELSLGEHRGRPVLLVFSDPTCAPCNRLAPELERLHRSRPDLDVVMVSRGELAANLQKIDEHGLTFPVALQRHWDTSRAYGKFEVPIAYLIDEEGVLASGVATGADEILALVAEGPARAVEKEVVGRGL
jgi:peroxiredoxin